MRLLFVLLFIVQSFIVFGQGNSRMAEMICITPYIPDEVQLPADDLKQLLLDKLTQLVTQNGLGYKGYDNRFVISTNIQNISESRTSTIPAKTVLKISVTLYVGDGKEGTLFSSGNIELKGIGKNREEAYRSALYKIRPNNKEVVQCLEVGKNRILVYYDSIGESIMQQAEGLAASGDYDNAINSLFTIPMPCKHYQLAQAMIAKYSRERIEHDNKELLIKAKSVWSAGMDEVGAERAMNILDKVKYPSNSISTQVNKLCSEIASHLKQLSNQRWRMEMQQMQNRHRKEMAHIQSDKERSLAYIRAAATVAKAWVENRPSVIYRIYQWY